MQGSEGCKGIRMDELRALESETRGSGGDVEW